MRWAATPTLAVLALSLVAFLWLLPLPDSALAVGARLLLIALIIGSLFLWVGREFGFFENLADGMQIISAFVTVAAIVVAAGMYFFERRNQAQLATSLEAKIIRPASGKGRPAHVLLAVRMPIENRGHRAITIHCMGIDVLAPMAGKSVQRSSSTREEMQLARIPEQIRFHSDVTQRCLQEEMKRRNASLGSIRPLFMWEKLVLEPNEIDDRHFEIPISCQFPFVRVIWKMRVRPEDSFVAESKTLVSIWDACQGETGSSGAGLTPSIQAPTHDSAAPTT